MPATRYRTGIVIRITTVAVAALSGCATSPEMRWTAPEVEGAEEEVVCSRACEEEWRRAEECVKKYSGYPFPAEVTVTPDRIAAAPERLLVRLDGVFYAPGSVIELSPGKPIEIEVRAHPTDSFSLEPRTPNWASFVVETDASAERLSIRHWIAWREFSEAEHPESGDLVRVGSSVGIIRLEAVESGANADPGRIHQIRIGAPAGGFPGPPEIEVDTTPLRFRVVAPSPAISCDELTLTADSDHRSGEPGGFFRRLFAEAGEFDSGRIRLRAPGFGAGLRLVAPYRFRGGELTDTEWDPSAQRKTDEIGFPFLFAAGMNLRAVEGGFEQTFELGWFDELELVAHAPGCEPRRLRCDTRGSCFTD